MGNLQFGIDPSVLDKIASDVSELIKMGVEVGLVLGGGNLFRGKALSEAGLGRVTGDHMGMLATVMNALAMRDALERVELPTRIMSAISMTGMVDSYDQRKAMTHLRCGHVVIFAAGTGNPFFTTDTAAALRGAEIGAEIVLKATKVDGVYDADPKKVPTAKRYTALTFDSAMQQNLGIMDAAAFALCRDQKLPIKVFSIFKHGALKRVVMGEDEGTLVHV